MGIKDLNIQAIDAINKVWLPRVPEGMTLHHVGIYDRWGNEVFAATDESESWDGRFSGQIVSTGNYVYVLKLINDKGVEQAYVGSIMVLGGE